MISSNPQQTTTVPQQPASDIAYREAPFDFEDSIANICWFPDEIEDVVACSSWDCKLRVYEVPPSFIVMGFLSSIASMTTEYPCISLAWVKEEKKLIGGAIDGSIYFIDPVNNLITTIGKHDDAVKAVYYSQVDTRTLFCSISYDKTIKLWDLPLRSCIFTCHLGSKPVCSDLFGSTIVIGLENEKLLIFDIFKELVSINNNPSTHYIDSPLGTGSQLSSVSISKDNVVGIGSYDGRSNLSSMIKRNDGTTGLTNIVTFKAHKVPSEQPNIQIMFPIHAVDLHPTNKNTYITAGGDGSIYFWDIPLRGKIANITYTGAPITAAKLSPNGKYLAYAIGYDWSRGIEGSRSIQPKFRVHTMQANEVSKSS